MPNMTYHADKNLYALKAGSSVKFHLREHVLLVKVISSYECQIFSIIFNK